MERKMLILLGVLVLIVVVLVVYGMATDPGITRFTRRSGSSLEEPTRPSSTVTQMYEYEYTGVEPLIRKDGRTVPLRGLPPDPNRINWRLIIPWTEEKQRAEEAYDMANEIYDSYDGW